MSAFTEQAYEMLTEQWGVDGDHDLRTVVDYLYQADTRAAIRELDYRIGCVRAQLRAYLTLRSALDTTNASAIGSLAEKDMTDIDDWPDRVEI